MAEIVVQPPSKAGIAGPEPTTAPIVNHYLYNTTLIAADTAKKISFSKKLAAWVPDNFSDSGVLELDEVIVHYLPYSKAAWINFGFASENSSVKTSTIGLGEDGHSSAFTELMPGGKYSVSMKVPARFSKRLQGTPVAGMPAQFKLTASLNMKIVITRRISLHGVQVIYEDLKC